MYNDKLTQSIAEAAKKCMDEELKGQQHKLDVNKNNKIDSEDLKHLRAGKKPVEEAMQKADVPAYLRKQKGEKPLSVADVKGPRPDSISSKEGLAKLRNEEIQELDELSKDTLKSYRVKSIGRAGEFENKGYEAAKKAGAGSDKADKLFNKADAVTVARQRAQEKMREEVEQIEEADIEKTATGMRVYGSSYGNSVRARREQVKKSIDTAKGPKMKDIESIEAEKKKKKKFSEMVETYVQSGIQGLFEGWKKVKEEATNDEFKSELEKQQAKADGKAPQADVAKAAVQAVQQEETIVEGYTVGEKTPNKQGGHNQDVHYNGKKIGHIESYSHRTGIRYGSVHQASGDGSAGMKSHDEAMADLKAIHKDHMNSVKEEVEQLDELKKSTLGSYVKKASSDAATSASSSTSFAFRSSAAKNPRVKDAAAKYSDEEHTRKEKRLAGIGKAVTRLAKEEVEQVEERTLSEPEMKKREEIVKSMKKGIQGFKDRYGDRAKEVMYATATKQAKKD